MVCWKGLTAALLSLALAGCAGTSATGGGAVAGTAASAGQSVASNTAAEEDDGVICKRVQRTGTRISDRVCTTREQRRAAAAASRDAVNQIGVTATQVGGLPDGG